MRSYSSPVLYNLLLLAALIAHPVSGQDCSLYINGSDGGDGNDGTLTAPIRSLEEGYSRASDGDILCVAAGEYAFGPDSDGIVFEGQRSVTFRLNAFAGVSKVLIAAPSVTFNTSSGSVRFEAGTTDQLVFGQGPTSASAVHSMVFTSGTADFSGVSTTLGSTVGSTADAGAALVLGGGSVIGTPVWAPGARRIRSDGNLQNPVYDLPLSELETGSLLELVHTGSLTLTTGIDVSNLNVRSTSSGETHFTGTVQLPSGAALAGPDAGFFFDGTLQLIGTETTLDAKRVVIARLASTSNQATGLYITADTVSLERVSEVPAPVQLSIDAAEAILGSPSIDFQLPGATTVTGTLTAAGVILTNGHALTAELISSAGVGVGVVLNDAGSTMSVTGDVDAFVTSETDASVTVGGRMRRFQAEAGTTSFLTPTAVDTLVVGDAGAVRFEADNVSTVGVLDNEGRLVLPGGATLTLELQATIAAEATTDAMQGTLQLMPPFERLSFAQQITSPVVSYALNGTLYGNELASLEVRSGALLWSSDTDAHSENISISAGELSIAAPSLAAGSIILSAGALLLQVDAPLLVSNEVIVDDGSLVLPEAGIGPSAGSTPTFQFEQEIVLPTLYMDAPGATVSLKGDVTLQGDLHLEASDLIITENAGLTIFGSISRNKGVFEPTEGGYIQLAGSGSRILDGFSSTVLPPMIINGPDVLPTSNTTVIGDFDLVTGSVTVPSGSTLSISGRASLEGGQVTMGEGSTFFVNKALTDSGGTWQLDASTVLLNGADNLLEGTYSGQAARLEIGGSTTVNGNIQTDELRVSTSMTLSGTGTITTARELILEQGSLLDIASDVVTLSPSLSDARILNQGEMSGSAYVAITGDLATFPVRLEGDGYFGRLRIDLDKDDAYVLLGPSVDTLRVGDNVEFSSGGIDVDNKLIQFSGDPVISQVLTNRQGTDADIDGKGFINRSRMEGAASLHLQGAMTAPFLITEDWIALPLIDLSVAAFDAVNTIPVFPIQLDGAGQLTGTLTTISGSRVTLSNGDLTLSGATKTHQIDGYLSGNRTLIMAGQGSTLSTGLSSDVSSLSVAVPGGARGVLDIQGRVRRLEVQDSSVEWYPADGDNPMIGDLSLTNSDMTTSGAIYFMDADISVTSSRVRFSDMASWYLDGASSLRITADSEWTPVTDVDGNPNTEAGSLHLAGEVTLDTAIPLPDIRLDTGTTASLEQDLRVTSRLTLKEATLALGSYGVFLEDVVMTIAPGTSGEGSVIRGDFETRTADVMFLGTSTINLDDDLAIQAATVLFDVEAVRFEGPSTAIMSVSTGSVVFQSGEVDLGYSDLHVTGSLPDLVRFENGRVTSSVNTTPPVRMLSGEQQVTPVMLRHDEHGELVVSGSGNAGITLISDLAIPSLRVRGSVRFNGAGYLLTVSERFVFGAGSGSVGTSAGSSFGISEDGWVIREGSGILSALPGSDPYNLIYHLDDGSWAEMDRTDVSGDLTTGNELIPSLNSLHVVAGNAGSTVHRVSLASETTVSRLVSAVSGILETNDRLRLSGGTWIAELDVDVDAPGTIMGLLSVENDANINWNKSITRSEPLSLPVGLDTLVVNFGRSQLNASLTEGLSLRELRLSGLEGDESRLRLNGYPVAVAGNMSVNNVRLSSAQVAEVVVQDTLRMPSGTIAENIRVIANGPALVEGTVTNLSFVVSSDLVLETPDFAPQTLRFTGTSQQWTVSDNLVLSSVVVDQEYPGELNVSAASPVDIRIAGGMQLMGGVVSSRNGAFVLDGSVFRSNAQDVPSHFEAPVRQRLFAGKTTALVYPMGFGNTYRPLTMTPAVVPLSDTYVTVSAVTEAGYPRAGLPIASGEITYADVDRRLFILESDINFAQSLPVNLTILATDLNASESVGLVMNTGRAWEIPTGQTVSTPSAEGLLLQQIGLRGLLVGSPVRIGVGSANPLSDLEASYRFVNLTSKDVTFRDGSRSVSVPSGSASSTYVLGLLSSSATRPIFIDYLASGDEMSAELTLTDGQKQWMVLGNTSEGETTLEYLSTGDERDGRVLFLNETASWPAMQVRVEEGATSTLLEILETGELSIPHALPETSFGLLFTPATSSSIIGHFEVAAATRDEGRALWIVEESSADPLRIRRFDVDGLPHFLQLKTAVSRTPAAPLPEDLKLRGTYPNPARHRATLTLDLPQPGVVLVSIVDLIGRQVYAETHRLDAGHGQHMEIDTSRWAAGLYAYTVTLKTSDTLERSSGTLVVVR
jgi:hypothetical protein